MAIHRFNRKLVFFIAIVLFFSATAYSGVPPHRKGISPSNGSTGTRTAAGQPGLQAFYVGLADLEKFPPGDSFTVQFEQPMDPAGSEFPLMSFPYVEGTYSWWVDNSMLVFQPVSPLALGETYAFFLDPGLRTARGISLDQTLQWIVRVDEGPAIGSISPAAGALKIRKPDEFEIVFDRDMDRVMTAKSFSIRPSMPLKLVWRDARTLIVDLVQPFRPDTRYDFMLAGTEATFAATGVDGIPMVKDYVWSYWLDPVQATVATTDKDTVEVTFNYAVDKSATGCPFAISPALEGNWTWVDDSKARFVSTEPIPLGRQFSLTITGPLVDGFGPMQIAHADYSFSAVPPVRIDTYASKYGEGVPVDYPAFRVFFDVAVDHASAEAAFRISPEIGGSFVWTGDSNSGGLEMLEYRPDRLLDAATTYKATISPSVKSSQGQPILVQPVEAVFTTDPWYDWDISPTYGVGSDVQVVDAGGLRTVQFGSPENASIRFDLYSYRQDDYVQLYAGKYGDNGLRFGTNLLPVPAKNMTPLATWSYTAPADQNQAVRETSLPADVPPGLYLLNMTYEGRLYDQLFLVLTNNALVLKQSGNQLSVWLSHINGKNVEGAEIRLYSSRGEVVRQGMTDRNGTYSTTIPDGVVPMLVTARHVEQGSDDVTISGLDRQYRTIYPNYWEQRNSPSQDRYQTYIYTERPIYRPGQVVYFKAVVRKDNDVDYQLPPAGTPVTVNIRDGRKTLLQTDQLNTNTFGSIDGSFRLGEEAVLGQYTIEAVVGGESRIQTFRVEDYRKPDYSVTLHALDPKQTNKIVIGGSIELQAEVEYFFGEPVAGAKVSTQVYYLSMYYDWSYVDNVWKSTVAWYETSAVAQQSSGETDSEGKAHITLTAGMMGEYEGQTSWHNSMISATYALQVTVDDGSDQSISATYILTVNSASEVIAIDNGGYFQRPGQPFTVRASAENLAGDPVSGRAVTLEASQWDHTEDKYRTVDTYYLTTDSFGRADQELTLASGCYDVELTGQDADSRPMKAATWVYVFSSQDEWFNRTKEEVAIYAGRDSYQPGQTGRFMIESTFSGPAMLTFERGHVIRSIPVELTAPLTVVETKILPDYAPNVYVTVNAWQPTENIKYDEYDYSYWGSNRPDSHLRLATTDVQVDAGFKQLQVAISTDREEYAPGESMQVSLTVTDPDGNPVPSEISLAVVDESIFTMADEQAADIFSAFYGPRLRSVRTYDSMSPDRIIFQSGGGQGGGGGEQSPAVLRSDFQDTAAWFPALSTDAAGHLTVSVPLPDNLTSWRLTAKAISKNSQVGESFINIKTKKELIVRPSLPRILTTGDKVKLTTYVHNYGDGERRVTVTFQADGLRLQGDASQTVTVGAGEVLPVQWPVVVEGVRPSEVVVTAVSADGLKDAVRLPISIQPATTTEVFTQSGEFKGSTRINLPWPRVVPETSWATLQLSRTMSGTLLGGLEYLTGYPYGCIEQTMSRALPNAVVGRAGSLLGLEDPGFLTRLDPLIRASIQRLVNFQHSDGGWGWWYDDMSTDYQTAWVLFGLAQMKDAGYSVDDAVIDRGVRYLAKNLSSMDVRTRAFALYSMALNGRGDLSAAHLLAEKSVGELDPFSQAGLALALHTMGDAKTALAVLSVIGQRAIRVGSAVYWPQPTYDGEYNSKTMSSTLRTTALILDGYVTIDPTSDLIPGTVGYLLGRRHGRYGWGTTNETSFTILALTDYLVRQELQSGDSTFQVNLNDQLLTGGILTVGKNTVIIPIPVAQLKMGGNILTVSSDGDADLYYDLSAQYSIPAEQTAPAGSIQVTRRYLDPATGQAFGTIRAGQMVQAELTVVAPVNASYVIVEDHLPGGLEALNENLNTTPFFGGNDSYDSYEDPYQWEDLGYNYKEIRNDRVAFFITDFRSGQHVFTYMARATSAGEFLALPVQVYAMYEPGLWGRSASVFLVIEE
jgi:uncharacterized protein YfaS (alpha-2-macroglobulin family)